MLVGTERVQGMSRQRVLHQTAAPAEVHDRDDRPVGVVLDCDRTRIAAFAIHEVRERHDPLVAKPVGAFGADHPREVALLRPELGRVRELSEQKRNDLVAVERPRLPYDLVD